MFFSVVYISGSLVLGAVFSVVSVSILFTPCLPPVLTLSISLLLAFKATFDLNSIIIKLDFILKAIYNYSFIG